MAWSSNISVLLAMLEQPSTAVRDGALKGSVRATSGRARMRQEKESLRWIGIECCSLVERSCSCCFSHTSLPPAAFCLGNDRWNRNRSRNHHERRGGKDCGELSCLRRVVECGMTKGDGTCCRFALQPNY